MQFLCETICRLEEQGRGQELDPFSNRELLPDGCLGLQNSNLHRQSGDSPTHLERLVSLRADCRETKGLWNLYEVAFEDLDRGQGKLQRLFPPAGSGRDRREASQLIKTRQQRLLVS